MLFPKKAALIVYLKKDSLEFIGDNDQRSEAFAFSKEYIKDLKILDKDKFKQLIIDFLIQASFKKQHAMLVLADDLIIKKAVPLSDKAELQKVADDFFAKAPIPEENLVQKTLANKTDVYLIATNREIYQIVSDAFDAVGWKIDNVVPLLLFGKSDTKITFEDASEMLKSRNLIKTGDFLLDYPLEKYQRPNVKDQKQEEAKEKIDLPAETEGKKMHSRLAQSAKESDEVADKTEKESRDRRSKGSTVKYIIIGIIILFIAGIAGASIQFGLFSKITHKSSSVSTVMQPKKPVVTPTPTPTVQPTKKEALKIQIQNGTGTAGQAKSVSDMLVKLGFTASNISTGNADTTNHVDTEVTFAPTVSKSDQDAITKILQQAFKNVVVKNSSGSSSQDVVIITGQSLQ